MDVHLQRAAGGPGQHDGVVLGRVGLAPGDVRRAHHHGVVQQRTRALGDAVERLQERDEGLHDLDVDRVDLRLIAANPTSGRGGDLIVAIDGRAVNNFQELNSYLVFHTQAGQTIQLTVVRDGSTTTIPLTLGTRP